MHWAYEIKFSEDWSCIESGGRMITYEDGEKEYEDMFPGVWVYTRYKVEVEHVYVQEGGIGHASYHISPDNSQSSCINYENAPKDWKTDDGQKFPLTKPFVDPSFDDHTFKGKILWSDSPVNGNVRWEYKMVFSED